MTRSRAIAIHLAVAAASVGLAGPADAQPPDPSEAIADYQIGSAAWNGLSTLEALARGMGLDVVEERSLDWDDLERGDILFLLYPTNRIDPQNLTSFLHNGGRVLVADPFEMLPRILHAGEVLLGNNASIPFGNFAIGVNAILPTAGMARSQSSVGVLDFMKRSGFSYVTDEGAAAIGPVAVALATYEDFPAHAAAARHVLSRIR